MKVYLLETLSFSCHGGSYVLARSASTRHVLNCCDQIYYVTRWLALSSLPDSAYVA